MSAIRVRTTVTTMPDALILSDHSSAFARTATKATELTALQEMWTNARTEVITATDTPNGKQINLLKMSVNAVDILNCCFSIANRTSFVLSQLFSNALITESMPTSLYLENNLKMIGRIINPIAYFACWR